MKTQAKVTAVVGLLLGTGCATGVTNFTPTSTIAAPPRAFEQEMMSYLPPARPSISVGHFQTAGFDTPDLSLKSMREKAAALGLDGISEIRCNTGKLFIPGAGWLVEAIVNKGRTGDCSGNGFVWRQP